MVIAYVPNDATASVNTLGSSLTLAFPNTPTNGNVLIVVTGYVGDSAHKPLGSLAQTGVTWNAAPTIARYSANYFGVEIWFGKVGASAGKNCVITVYRQDSPTTLFNCDIIEACGMEFSGLGSLSYKDVTNSNNGGSTTVTTGAISTNTAAELLIGGASDYHSGGTSTLTSTNPAAPTYAFTMIHTGDIVYSSDHLDTGLFYRIVSSTGTYNTGATVPASACTWWAAIVGIQGTTTNNVYSHTFAQYMGGLPAKTSFKSVIKTIAQYMAGKGTLTGHAHAVNITGYTRDSNGTPLGSVTVYLYRTSDDALIGSTTSNASTGAYAFNNVPYTNYYLVAMLKGSPDKFGCTDNNIT